MANLGFDLSKLKNIKLTKEQQQWVAAGILLAAGAVYGYWSFVIVPINQDIVKYDKEIKEKEANLKKARELKSRWEDYKQRLAKVQTGIQYVSKRLPSGENQFWEWQKLIKMIAEGDVTLLSCIVDRNSSIKSEFEGYKKTVSAINMGAEFHKLGKFLSRLSGEDIVYNIEDLQINSIEGKTYNISANMKLITYSDASGQKKK